MNQAQRKHNFLIKKVPLKRVIPERHPEPIPPDSEVVCIPSNSEISQHSTGMYSDTSDQSFQQEFNQNYTVNISNFKLRDERMKKKSELQNELQEVQQSLNKEREEHQRLLRIRTGLYNQIETLRDDLTQSRDKNYNLRWEIYHRRGVRYANMYGYAMMEPNQMTYEELLQMEEQMGVVSRGLTSDQIDNLDRKQYQCEEGTEREICCICYDQIEDEEWVTVLKCSHTHHCDCIKDWLLTQKLCPICKQEVLVQENEPAKFEKGEESKEMEGNINRDHTEASQNPQNEGQETS